MSSRSVRAMLRAGSREERERPSLARFTSHRQAVWLLRCVMYLAADLFLRGATTTTL